MIISENVPFLECLKELVKEGKFETESLALKALMAIPRMIKKPKSILVSNKLKNPDVYLFYLRPKEFMIFVQASQRVTGEELKLSLSSVMPVCGACTVRPFVTGEICISFGCKESREYGGITDDRFVVGIPSKKAEIIVNSLEYKLEEVEI